MVAEQPEPRVPPAICLPMAPTTAAIKTRRSNSGNVIVMTGLPICISLLQTLGPTLGWEAAA